MSVLLCTLLIHAFAPEGSVGRLLVSLRQSVQGYGTALSTKHQT